MHPLQQILVKQSWRTVSDRDPADFLRRFFHRLHLIAPEMRVFWSDRPRPNAASLFRQWSLLIDEGAERSFHMPAPAAWSDIPEGAFPIVGSALLWTLEQELGAGWTDALEEAWVNAYRQFGGTMIDILLGAAVV